jgi:hypothetical protein
MDPILQLPAVREVSLLIDPEQPTTITQRAFDEARTQSAVPNLPRAKRIVENLNAKRRDKRLTWAGVLVLAYTSGQEHVKTTSTQEADKQPLLTEGQIVDALILVSIRLKTKAFTRDAYMRELHKMGKEGIEVDWLRIPSETQIVKALARKLRQREDALPAGLHLRQPPRTKSSTTVKAAVGKTKTVSKAATPPKRKRRAISTENAWKAALEMAELEQVERAYLPSPSVSTLELLERCFAKHNTQLTRDEARIFAQANNIPYSRARQQLSWGEAVAVWKKGLEARGVVPPPGPPPTDKRPEYSRNVGAGHPAETRRIGWTDIDACLVDVSAYLKQLPAGELSTFAGFQHWIEAQGRTPPARGAFTKHGGWSHVRQLAYERMYPGFKGADGKDESKDHKSAVRPRARTKPSSDAERATKTRTSAPESEPLGPGDILRALNFRSSHPKKRRAPNRNTSPPKTRINGVQSERVQASKRPGKMPGSGSTT